MTRCYLRVLLCSLRSSARESRFRLRCNRYASYRNNERTSHETLTNITKIDRVHPRKHDGQATASIRSIRCAEKCMSRLPHLSCRKFLNSSPGNSQTNRSHPTPKRKINMVLNPPNNLLRNPRLQTPTPRKDSLPPRQ